MKKLFADTVYWVALLNPKDSLHKTAVSLTNDLTDCKVISTDAILIEVLNEFSSYGSYWRKSVAQKIKDLLRRDDFLIYPLNRNLFLEGLYFYESRLDKEYSQVDCMSMVIMKRENITDVLTNDHHFEQEGFAILLKK